MIGGIYFAESFLAFGTTYQLGNNSSVALKITLERHPAATIAVRSTLESFISSQTGMVIGLLAFFTYSGGRTTISLSATLETSRNLGKAITFSGGGYIDIPYTSGLHPTDVLTVAVTASSPNWSGFVNKRNVAGYASGGSGFLFDANDTPGDGTFRFILHRGGSYVFLNIQLSALTPGRHRFVGTFDGRFTKFYVDGILFASDDFGSQTTIDQPTHNDVAIGDNMASGSTPEGNPWNSSVDEFLLVHAAWTATDVSRDYSTGNPLNRRTLANISGLVVGMHFDDNTTNDFSGNNNNGTIVGTATYITGWHVLTPPVALITTFETPASPVAVTTYENTLQGGSLPANWLQIGNSTWTWTSTGVVQTTTNTADPNKLLYTGLTTPQQRIVQAKVIIGATGGFQSGVRTGIVILGSNSTNGIDLLIVDGQLSFLDDLLSWGTAIGITANIGETWWIKGMYVPSTNTFYGKAWKNNTTEPANWLITWTRTPQVSYLYSGILGSSNNQAGGSTFFDFSIALPNYKTVALKTTLQSTNKNLTEALLTSLFPPVQRATFALLTNVTYLGTGTVALITSLEKTSRVPYPRGITLSGLELGTVIPGLLNTDFFQSAQTTYTYFANKGFPLVRLPILWERMQPTLNGSLNTTYKSYLDAAIQEATNAGQSVILDLHNFGRRSVINPGGFSLLTSGTTDPMFQGTYTLSGGVMTFAQSNRIYAGAYNNPVAPATTYSFQTDIELTADLGQPTNGVWIEFFRVDDNNRYYLVLSHQNNTIQFYQVVNGTQIQLNGTISQTIAFNTWYTITVDVGQMTPNTVTVSFNGTQIFSQTRSPQLTSGFVAFFGNGANGGIRNFTLNVAGDTTSGRTGSGNFRVGDTGLTTAHFADLWTKLATAYKTNPQVYGYDLMHEPHDMPVPTTPSTYNSTATVTLMNQAAITAIRAVDTHKWLFVENDSSAATQQFVSLYGSNPTPYYTDPSHKTVYVAHYYFDNDHSGTYQQAFAQSNFTAISGDLTPFFSWIQSQGLWGMLGAYGVPNTSEWQSCLTKALDLANQYGIWAVHFAAGDHYSGVTQLNPVTFGPPLIDAYQMQAVGRTTYLGMNLDMGTVSLLASLRSTTPAPVALSTTLEVTSHSYFDYNIYGYFGDLYFGSVFFGGAIADHRTDAIGILTTLEATVPVYPTLDQQNLLNGTQASSGQFTGIRYRGFGFTANTTGYVRRIAFQRTKGTQDIKISLDTANTDSTPIHAVGNELYAFTVANAQLTGNYQSFTLPVSFPVTRGVRYSLYVAPWSITNNQYQNDLQPMFFSGGTYTGGQEITNTNGTWSNEALIPVYSISIQPASTISVVTLLFQPSGTRTLGLVTRLSRQQQITVASKTLLEKTIKRTVGTTVSLAKPTNRSLAIITSLASQASTQFVIPIGLLLTLTHVVDQLHLSLLTVLEKTKLTTIAVLTKFEGKLVSCLGLKTQLEKPTQQLSVAIQTILQSRAFNSQAIALKTICETAAKKSTVALITSLAKPGTSPVAIATFIQATHVTPVALLTSFQTTGVTATVALLTRTERTQVKSTIALLTQVETALQTTSLGIRTTLQTALQHITSALLTQLEKAAQQSTIALNTSIQSSSKVFPVAVITNTEKPGQFFPVALTTHLETTNLFAPVAVKSSLEKSAQFSTVAIQIILEKAIQKAPLALSTLCEHATQVISVALKTNLESANKVATTALITLFESSAQYRPVALFTRIEATKNKTLGIFTPLEGNKLSTTSLKTTLEVIPQVSRLGIKVTLSRPAHSTLTLKATLETASGTRGINNTVALTTRMLHFIGWHNDDFRHLGWIPKAQDEDPAPPFGIAQDGHPMPPIKGFVDDGSQW